ncbi:XdhC family protein [Fictibacillus sp. FJAT-27399]|uniref:XdhC family protein n=1 Tax=Fictibacillus sp. FJAT-27399 TaxID=1729689 RepID=UPI000781C538|nr:XdhC family protein [Fictibacillus sp. FJAT-27399]
MNKLELYEKLSTAITQKRRVSLLTITAAGRAEMIGKRMLFFSQDEIYPEAGLDMKLAFQLAEICFPFFLKQRTRSVTFESNDETVKVFHEAFAPPPHLIIGGAGHVAEPVAKMGKMLGFYTSVIDDRQEFARKERFPFSDNVCCQSFHSYFKSVPLNNSTYILLLTRGHQFDVLSLQQLLARNEKPAYIGMIGSRRRIAGVFEQLRADFPNETFANLYTPVGLDIGAETPEEIAVSIFAEILAVKKGKTGAPLSSTIRELAKIGFRKGKKDERK